MRVLVQRVSSACVRVEGREVGAIGAGLVALVGVAAGDEAAAAEKLAGKVARLRIFDNDDGRMDRSLLDLGAGGAVLCISQFTLCGDARKGNRPNFGAAAAPEDAEHLYGLFCERLAFEGLDVKTGLFGARMQVELCNEGPVTLLLEA
jgi:D-tyrosyl-tRNA(Tyr) deacylase